MVNLKKIITNEKTTRFGVEYTKVIERHNNAPHDYYPYEIPVWVPTYKIKETSNEFALSKVS